MSLRHDAIHGHEIFASCRCNERERPSEPLRTVTRISAAHYQVHEMIEQGSNVNLPDAERSRVARQKNIAGTPVGQS